MDHTYVEEHGLVDAYLAGRLAESDRDAFEAHYFACETCLEHLETANAFREGMRQAAAEDIAQAAAVRTEVGLFAALAAGLATLSRRHRLALAGILLLLAALPSLWLIQRQRAQQQSQQSLAAAAATAEHQRDALEARLHSLEQAAADRGRLAQELAEERRAREASLQQTSQPQINVPLFLLAAVRSGEAGREPASQIPLPSTAGSVILTAELATVDYPAYRASLHAAGGKEIWQAQGLHPDSRDTLVLLLPAGMLQPGVYRLTVEGMTTSGASFAVAAYPFQVVRRP